jgi:hypothetical protein
VEYIKVLISLLLSIHLFGIDSLAQNLNVEASRPSKISGDSVEIIIKGIRKEFNKINSDTSKMRVTKEDKSGQSTEGGTITKFYDGNTLKKVRLVFYGETGKSTTEYYFLNGQLFFCFEQNDHYNKPIYEKNMRVNKKEENRFYFNKQKLIRWITDNGKIADKSLYPTKEKEIFDDLQDIH